MQTANSKQQTANSKQQTAKLNSKKQIHYLWILVLVLNIFTSCTSESEISSAIVNLDPHFITIDNAKSKVEEVILLDREDINPQRNGNSSLLDRDITSTTPIYDDNGNISLYVLNFEGGGYILLAADDRKEPILAYSNYNTYDIGEDLNTGLAGWLSQQKGEIKEIRDINQEQTDAIAEMWRSCNMRSLIIQVRDGCDDGGDGGNGGNGNDDCNATYEIIGPLLQTKWHQGCGFNSQLSETECGSCGRYLAGCVPIAIAQTMRYFEHPPSYNWNNMSNISGNGGVDGLIKDIHDAINEPLADIGGTVISYRCGATGVDKDYNTAQLFTNSLGYSSASQGSFSATHLYQNLLNNKPVILGGGHNDGWWIFDSYDGGHMWVCDGFQRTLHVESCTTRRYYHMKWGWFDGQRDGWFIHSNWTPPGTEGFNFERKIIYNITP